MLNLACRNTGKLIREKSASENIRLGRLFTKKETARRMASMFSLDETKNAYTVLDPGAGTGILSAAIVERICREVPKCRQIFLTCYETDETYLPMLEDNLERIRKKCRHDYDVKLFVTVYPENYITDAKKHYTVTLTETAEDTFDLIICNPPTGFCEKKSEEASSAGGITQVKISEAYLFVKTAMRHLEPEGQLAVLLPTAFSTAAALTPIRREIFSQAVLDDVHLFVGKQKNVRRAIPLKKNMILLFRRGEAHDTVNISTSTDEGSAAMTIALPPLSYAFVVDEKDGSLTLPKSVEDTRIVKYISDFPETLSSLGLKMSTGLILDSRCDGLLFSEPIKGTVPLRDLSCLPTPDLFSDQHAQQDQLYRHQGKRG